MPPKAAADEDLPTYRAITQNEESDEDELEGVRALGRVSTLEEDIKTQTGEVEHHLASNPTDIDQWIKFSTLHMKLSPESSKSSAFVDLSKQPITRANAEVTLSILSRALDADPSNFASSELHIAFLRAAELFWPADKVLERWKNVIRTLDARGVPEENMMGLYLVYIEWREGQGFGQAKEGTGVDDVVEVYIECLEKLKAGRNGESPVPSSVC